MRRAPDLLIYLRAIPLIARTPSVLAGPLLGAVVAIVLNQVSLYATAQIGYLGASILTWIADIFFSYTFAIAIIQADALQRGMRGTFDGAWEEARRKAGGIIVAAIGFWFLIYIAIDIGALVGSTVVLVVLELLAAFFLIYVIPASAIGGLPGTLAIGGSYRAAVADVVGTAVLASAFVVFFLLLPPYIVTLVAASVPLTNTEGTLIVAFLQAIALGYLAFPFAKQYADVAYRR